jgi:hypothetical protein
MGFPEASSTGPIDGQLTTDYKTGDLRLFDLDQIVVIHFLDKPAGAPRFTPKSGH